MTHSHSLANIRMFLDGWGINDAFEGNAMIKAQIRFPDFC
jgi:hypothetical protein